MTSRLHLCERVFAAHDIRLFDGRTGDRLGSISLGLTRGGDIAGLKCEGP